MKNTQMFVHILAVPLRFPDKIVLHYHPANPSDTRLIGSGSYELKAETWAAISQRLIMSSSYLNEKERQLRRGNNVNLGFHFVALPDDSAIPIKGDIAIRSADRSRQTTSGESIAAA